MSAHTVRGGLARRFGQHFLLDRAILDRIALAAGPVAGEAVVEIGPGPGGLTKALLAAGSDPLITIEIDRRLASALKDWSEVRTGRLRVLHADAARIDWHDFARQQSIASAKIIANLPYGVAGRLIVDWLRVGDWRREMVVMVQREVGERLCAGPGSGRYGRLSVLAQAVTRPNIAFTLPPGAFRPPPKVDSALVVMEPLPADRRFEDWESLGKVTAAAFGQRRKMLRASLKHLVSDPARLLSEAGIEETRRPETLTQAEFRCLSRAFASRPT